MVIRVNMTIETIVISVGRIHDLLNVFDACFSAIFTVWKYDDDIDTHLEYASELVWRLYIVNDRIDQDRDNL